MKTIIFAHPYEGSFGATIKNTLIEKFKQNGERYACISLYEDGFNPALSKEELAVYMKGAYKDSLVEKYQAILTDTTELFLVTPIWWFEFPAILKGFIDKVMLYKFAFDLGEVGLVGLLTQIKSCYILSTSAETKAHLQNHGAYVENVFINGTLKDVGIKNVEWLHLGDIDRISQEDRVQYLENLRNRF